MSFLGREATQILVTDGHFQNVFTVLLTNMERYSTTQQNTILKCILTKNTKLRLRKATYNLISPIFNSIFNPIAGLHYGIQFSNKLHNNTSLPFSCSFFVFIKIFEGYPQNLLIWGATPRTQGRMPMWSPSYQTIPVFSLLPFVILQRIRNFCGTITMLSGKSSNKGKLFFLSES